MTRKKIRHPTRRLGGSSPGPLASGIRPRFLMKYQTRFRLAPETESLMTPSALIGASLLLLALALLARPAAAHPPEIRGPLLALWWLNRFYVGFWHRLEIENESTLPEFGPAILISNHTCGIDHLLLQAASRRVLGFIIAQEFYDNKIYHPFCVAIGCIPVKRDGRDQASIRHALRSLKEGRVVAIFPEGKINPSSGREFHDAKPGAAFIPLRAGVPVIPAYIRGTPPSNEIVDALITPSRARVVFGDPIDLSDLVGGGDREAERAHIAEATERIMGAIRALRDQALADPARS